jgi:glycosyltransferase involved in cell wall biosynthesis
MFSVVIPLYNKAHTIQRTLGTVLNQTFRDFEVVIVDDGSTDNGAVLIRETVTDPRVRIVEQVNMGVSSARNNGVLHSKYDYIAFLDGDDEWLPGYLAKMHEAIALHPDACMFCCAGTVTAKDCEVTRIAHKYKGMIKEIDFFENPHIFLHTSAAVVRKDMFNKAGGFPASMKRNEDYALFFSLAFITKVVYCGFPLSTYVGNVAGQATTTPIKDVLLDIVDRFNVVQRFYKNLSHTNESYEVFTRYELRHMFVMNLRDGNVDSNRFLLEKLDKSILKLFPQMERELYGNASLSKLSIWYILLTKIRWRMRGYPYIGQTP